MGSSHSFVRERLDLAALFHFIPPPLPPALGVGHHLSPTHLVSGTQIYPPPVTHLATSRVSRWQLQLSRFTIHGTYIYFLPEYRAGAAPLGPGVLLPS